MPTKRRRSQVTHSERLNSAIQVGRRYWPDAPISHVIEELAVAGAASLAGEKLDHIESRVAAIRGAAGSFSGTYGPGTEYLAEVRQGWPE